MARLPAWGCGEDKWRAIEPACLVREHSLALLSVVSPLREAIFGGNGQTLTGFPGKARLDKVIKRHILSALA